MSLRNKVIRLAHEKPELRKHLLPLLKEASIPKNKRQFIQEYHDYMDSMEAYPSKEVENDIAKMWRANRAWAEEAEKTYKKAKKKVAGRLEDYDFLGEILNLRRYAYGENGVFVDEGRYTLRELQQILKKNGLNHLNIEDWDGGWHIT